jgi:hypothetical protein
MDEALPRSTSRVEGVASTRCAAVHPMPGIHIPRAQVEDPAVNNSMGLDIAPQQRLLITEALNRELPRELTLDA